MIKKGEFPEQNKGKVAIYIRVSTEEQAKEGISLAAQKDRCTKFCEAKGWEVVQVYEDAGYSAGTINRPAFKRLLEAITKGEFSILLVYKIDRFSRNLKDLINLLDDLKEQGVNFTSVTEPQIDTTTAMGEAFFQIIGVFAQLERGMVKERVELAFDKKISDGEYLNRAPMGYWYDDHKLVVNEDEAEIVREIFAMWAAGVHYREIAEKFEIPISTLYTLMRNPTYIGKIKYKGDLYDGNHPLIIDEGLFHQVNTMIGGEE